MNFLANLIVREQTRVIEHLKKIIGEKGILIEWKKQSRSSFPQSKPIR